MNNPLERFLEEVQESVTDPEKKLLVATITADLVSLISAAAAGADVGREITHVAAQARNIAASEAVMIQEKVNEFVTGLALQIVRGALLP